MEVDMFNLQGWDWFIIFMIVLLIFGGKKIPEIARGIGKGLREFKKAKDGIADSMEGIDKDVDISKDPVIPPAKPNGQEKTENTDKKG